MIRGSVLMLLIALSCQAAAGTAPVNRSISINAYGVDIDNATRDFGYNATIGAQGAIVMPNPAVDGVSSFQFGFTAPRDFDANQDAYLRVAWRSDAESCVVDLRNSGLYRSRPETTTDPGTLARESTLLASANRTTTKETRFKLTSIDIKPNDVVQGSLLRTSTLDTCEDDFHILGLSIIYGVAPNSIFADQFQEPSL